MRCRPAADHQCTNTLKGEIFLLTQCGAGKTRPGCFRVEQNVRVYEHLSTIHYYLDAVSRGIFIEFCILEFNVFKQRKEVWCLVLALEASWCRFESSRCY